MRVLGALWFWAVGVTAFTLVHNLFGAMICFIMVVAGFLWLARA